MKRTSPTSSTLTKLALILGIALAMNPVDAAVTDIATSPMANTGSAIVKPNLMWLLDTSGSMDWDYMGDDVASWAACLSTGSSLQACQFSDPPYNSNQYNGVAYSPAITYIPAVYYDGTSYPSYNNSSAPVAWTAVPNDAWGIQFTGTLDLTAAYPDTVWCKTSSPTTADLTAPFASGNCVRPIQGGVWTYPNSTFSRRFSAKGTLNAYYYTISSLVWCSSKNAQGFGTGSCQTKKTSTFQYPLYGTTGNNGFTRFDIVPGTATYPRAASRTDCTGAVGPTGCTYAQEMTNFANWYAYYRTRLQMIKSAAGLAFKSVTNQFRVGLITINPGGSTSQTVSSSNPVNAAHFLPINDFTAGVGGQKQAWYANFYAQTAAQSTPLREALSRVGRYYAHVTSGINSGITDDPVQYSCQQNFTLLSTDGFWNGNAGQDLSGNPVGNQDNNPVTAPRPLLDGSAQITTATSNNTISQQICTGAANAYGATPCGCAANFSRVKQQTSSSISTVVSRDGVVLSTTPSTSTTYQDITACNALVTTAVTPTTKVDQQVVIGNATTTFATVNGIATGANTAGLCAANFGQIMTRTTNATSTVITTGGVAAAPVLGATYSFAAVGSCVPLVVTSVTPVTLNEEQVVFGGVATTFAAVGGVSAGANQNGSCAAGQENRKHRTTTYNSTVVTTGGVAGAPTISGVVYAFSNVGSCVAPLVQTSTVTTTIVEQQVLVGNATSTFSAVNGVAAGANQAGACTAPQQRVKQRKTVYTTTTTTTDGVVGSPVVAGTTYTFTDVGSCVSPNVVVTRTPTTIVEQQVLNGAAMSTFAAVNGVSAGDNQAGVCTSGQFRVKQRTTTYNTDVTTTDGVVTGTSINSTAYAFTDPGFCSQSTTVTPVTETAQWVGNRGSNVSSGFSAAANGSNPQTTYTCNGSGNTVLLQRVLGYSKTVVTTNGVPGAPTFSGITSGPTFTTPQSCSSSSKTAAALSVVNGTPTVTTAPAPTAAAPTNTNGSSSVISSTGGPTPVAAATTSSNSTSNSSTGGPTPVAAATTSVNGTTTNTNSGMPTPAASTSVTGATTTTSTGAQITSANFTIAPITSSTTAGPTSTITTSTTTGPMGYSDTLADVAQYYYITDLRAPGSLGAAVSGVQFDVGTVNNVPGQPGTDPQNDSATWQHMTTFTLGLGVDGTLHYASDYRTNPTGDFLAIINGTMNWPQPVADTLTAVDDLWHAAVNGRGLYFSARDPAQLSIGLSNALAGIQAVTGSAAAAATSNLEPVSGDNFAYVASYETVRWNGDVQSRTIDLNTGALSTTSLWSAQAQLDAQTYATTPGGTNRVIMRFNAGSTNKLQNFTWANLSATEQAYFSTPWISTGATALSQWAALSGAQQTLASGSNLVSFLRGDPTYESQATNPTTNWLYRDRQHVLGDVVDGAPVYVRGVASNYADAGYASPAGASFKDCVNTGGALCSGIFNGPRSAVVYIAANDGMLHAIDANTGNELWAFVPNILLPNLYRLADTNYANVHQFYVDGSPTVGDVYDPVAAKWKTILVGGLGAGGRGYYGLDITDPANPIGLWEFSVKATASCPSAPTLGVDKTDCDLGLSYGNPIITKLGNGNWVVVVTSGYNNVNPGSGQGYVYVLDPISGVILKKIQAANATQFLSPGSTTTPLGLARINNWVNDTTVDNTTLQVYGGDLQGYMWRFNLDAGTAYAIARYTDPSGIAQPVTVKPELGDNSGISMIYVGTGRYLGTSDLASTQVQTVYAIKDVTNGVAPAVPINARGATLVAQTITDTTSGTGAGTRTVTANAVDLTTKNGWRVDLPDSGERVNIDPKLQLGTLIVGSNIPASNACTTGGTSYLNYFDYKTGGYIQSSGNTMVGVLVGNSLVVGISVVRLPNDKTVAIVTTSDNKYPNLAPPFSTPSVTGRRSTWRELPQ